jgi:hypothetical protein
VVVLEDYLAALAEPEVNRLSGAHATFDRPKIEAWLATRREHHDRADWAAVRVGDGAFLGEAVINEVDLENESASYRVWLAGPHVFGQGYGTEITRRLARRAAHGNPEQRPPAGQLNRRASRSPSDEDERHGRRIVRSGSSTAGSTRAVDFVRGDHRVAWSRIPWVA